MLIPTFKDTRVVDEYFIAGRNMWPDLKDIAKMEFRRDLVPPEAIRFMRSTMLNEYGVVHYTKGYFRAYGDDYKLASWAMIWGGEEYLHSILLRTILNGLGEEVSDAEYDGLESGEYEKNYDSYLAEKRDGFKMDRRLQQLVYGVLQEYSATIAYSSVADAVGDPQIERILRRMAKDETRHCRFNQRCLEELVDKMGDEIRAEIWPMFDLLFKDHRMPQEHIAMFGEFNMGTDLYISFWTPAHRSNLILYLTNYFRKFRKPRGAQVRVPDAAESLTRLGAQTENAAA